MSRTILLSWYFLICALMQSPSSRGVGGTKASGGRADPAPRTGRPAPPEHSRCIVAFATPEAIEALRKPTPALREYLRAHQLGIGEIKPLDAASDGRPPSRRFHLVDVDVRSELPPEEVLASLRKAPGVRAAAPEKRNVLSFVVRFRAEAISAEDAAKELRDVGLLTLRPTFGSRNLFEAIVVTDDDQSAALRKIRRLEGIAGADPNFTYEKRK